MVSLEDNLVMMPQGDIETIRTLFQQRPELWDDFKTLMELTDCLNEQERDYNKLCDLLTKISNGVLAKTEKGLEDFFRFATALRIAEKSVDFMRQTMLRKGLPFITEFTFPHPDFESACLYMLRTLFMNLSCKGREFAIQLAKTGVLKDLIEDFNHMQDQSAERLEKCGVFRINVGIILNCCRSPEGLAIVRTMNIKNNFIPFLSKDTPEIRALALSALSFLLRNEELDLLKLDRDVLQFLYQCIYGAMKSEKEYHTNGWTLEEVLFFLSRFARNYCNKRLILRTGGLKMLGMVLVNRTEVEQANAIKLLTQLAKETEGKLLMQADPSLLTILSKLESGDNISFQEQATDLLMTIREKSATPGHQEILTLLKDRVNMLAILDTSEVGFVLCQLQVLITEGRHNHNDFSAIQLLEILSNVVKGDKRGQQMIAEGCSFGCLLYNHCQCTSCSRCTSDSMLNSCTYTRSFTLSLSLTHTHTDRETGKMPHSCVRAYITYTYYMRDALIYIAIGGLDMLCCYLKKGKNAEKSLVLTIILDMMSDTEVVTVVRNNPVLLALLDEIRGSENEEFSQKANLIWQTLH